VCLCVIYIYRYRYIGRYIIADCCNFSDVETTAEERVASPSDSVSTATEGDNSEIFLNDRLRERRVREMQEAMRRLQEELDQDEVSRTEGEEVERTCRPVQRTGKEAHRRQGGREGCTAPGDHRCV